MNAMTRFFFHAKDHDRLIKDNEGLEFRDSETATAQCLVAAREILEESNWRDQPLTGRGFQIADESGKVVLALRLQRSLIGGTK